MLKILMIAPTMYFSDRGCHIRIYEQARALNEKGHEVTLLTYHNGQDTDNVPARRIWRTPWYNKLVAGPSLHFIYMDSLLLLRCFLELNKNKYDLVHAHLHEGAFIAHLVLKLCCGGTAGYIFDAQGSLAGEMSQHSFVQKGSIAHKFWCWLENRINRNARCIITSSATLAKRIGREKGVDPKKIHSITDGVDVKRFRPRGMYVGRKKLDKLRRRLGIPEQGCVVVYLGGMGQYKGVGHLVESIPLVLKENRSVYFLLMGYPGSTEVRKRILELGLENNVLVRGKIPYHESHLYLALGDIAVAPKLLGWGEANGKLLNYMGCGLPVVAFEHPVNREILGDFGIYADYGSAGSLSEKILFLAKEKGQRNRLGGKLREQAERHHSWEKVGERILEKYQSIIK